MEPRFLARNRAEWRAWLERHHASESQCWLVFYKKHVGRAGVGYADAVEEAICFGWIDGMKKGIDAERYAFRFTPRKSGSNWTPGNVERFHRMEETGRMTASGRRAFAERRTG